MIVTLKNPTLRSLSFATGQQDHTIESPPQRVHHAEIRIRIKGFFGEAVDSDLNNRHEFLGCCLGVLKGA